MSGLGNIFDVGDIGKNLLNSRMNVTNLRQSKLSEECGNLLFL
jgi:hypothetical protein